MFSVTLMRVIVSVVTEGNQSVLHIVSVCL